MPSTDRLRVTGISVVVVDTAVVVLAGGFVVVVDLDTDVGVITGGGEVVVADGLVVVVDGFIVVVVDTAVVVVPGGFVVVVDVDTDVVVVTGGSVVVVVDGLVVVVVVDTDVVVVARGLVVVVVVGEHNGVSTVAAFKLRAQAWPEVASRRPRSRKTKPAVVRPRPIRRIRRGSPRAFVPVAMTMLLCRSLPASASERRRSRVEGHIHADCLCRSVLGMCRSTRTYVCVSAGFAQVVATM